MVSLLSGVKPRKAGCHHQTPKAVCHCDLHRGHDLMSMAYLSSTSVAHRHVGETDPLRAEDLPSV